MLDTLAALWIVLAVEQALALPDDPRLRRSVLAGLFTGLALATKYFGGVVALPVVLAHLLAQRQLGGRRAWGRLVLAGGVAVAALLAFLPQIVTAPGEVLAALRYQRDTIGINLVNESGGAWDLAWHHVRHTFIAGFGETALLFAVAGGWMLWRRGGAARQAALAVPAAAAAVLRRAQSRGALRHRAGAAALAAAAACCEAAGGPAGAGPAGARCRRRRAWRWRRCCASRPRCCEAFASTARWVVPTRAPRR